MSTDEYAPSDEEMLSAYVTGRMMRDGLMRTEAEQGFRCGLARVRQEARAEGWERGHVCGYSDAQDTARNITHGPHNPYTKTGDSDEQR